LHDDPWPARDLVKRSMTRAEAIAKSDRSKTAGALLYQALATPLCVFINESDRLDTRLSIASYLDGDQPGRYTMPALEAFEPHVRWQRKFLQGRKICYAAARSPRAEQAARDFDDFMSHEASTGDVSALSKEIADRSAEKESNTKVSDSQGVDVRH
jgi:hypothetical protein